jgi:hypothetical protein
MNLSFAFPWLLLGFAALPAIWWLMRNMPPAPQRVSFPATRILKGIEGKEQTPDHTPWWLLLLRMLAAGLLIFAFAEPILDQPKATVTAKGPLVLVVDNTWAAAAHWDQRIAQAERLIGEADRDGLPVLIVPTVRDGRSPAPQLKTATDALTALAALQPQPLDATRMEATPGIEPLLAGKGTPNIFWLTDGLAGEDGAAFAAKLKSLGGALTVISPDAQNGAIALGSQLGQGGGLEFRVLRAGGAPRTVTVEALSAANQPLSEAQVTLGADASSALQKLEIPLELRNQIARLSIRGERSAGAVQLLDSGSRWNRIGLVSGASRESAQPLLGQLYYVERALKPFAELSIAEENDSATAIARLASGNSSVLVLADVGRVAGPAREAVEKFLGRGGIIVRFAGPRLEEGGDDLLPVDLRAGGRQLGGALSWSTPQPLAAFENDSPFFGLKLTEDVKISRQVLADPALLSDRTRIWARLADGTPLVTAQKSGKGWIVLYHVTANSDWSNLPLSGLFVDMLRRITRLTGLAELDRGDKTGAARALATGSLTATLTLDGFGVLGPPPPLTEALAAGAAATPDATHPPGLYGAEGTVRALNIVNDKTELKPLTGLPAGVIQAAYQGAQAWPLKPSALGLALALLLADMLAVLALQSGGLFGGRKVGRAAATVLALTIGTLLLTPTPSAHGAGLTPADEFALRASSATRIAYVMTGDAGIDDTSRRGLTSLTSVLQQRTAVEPGEPIGVEVDKDELVFFQILYWPVTKDAKELNEPTRARVDAFMKGGGMIVFDTLDEGDNVPGLDARAGSEAFQRLVAKLDIPRLEPVPPGHVMTKSFYLLKSFPGRTDGGALWVEAGAGSDPASPETGAALDPRQSDGVSSVLVTGNDLAGAWAADDNGQGLNPVVPGGEEQREFAYRVGVNIVMYALTGNYKADQVHVPAILERLGQ